MKSKALLLAVIATVILSVTSCRSSRSAIAPEDTAPKWSNAVIPCELQINKPVDFTIKGTLTMVNGKSALVSARFLGFEVAQIYITPQDLDATLKQPQKIWLHEDVASRLKKAGITFTDLQKALLGDPKASAKIEQRLPIAADGHTFRLVSKYGKTDLDAALSLDLDKAKWDVPSPATFKIPDGNFRKVSAATLTSLIK